MLTAKADVLDVERAAVAHLERRHHHDAEAALVPVEIDEIEKLIRVAAGALFQVHALAGMEEIKS